jgi:hypothetical protein
MDANFEAYHSEGDQLWSSLLAWKVNHIANRGLFSGRLSCLSLLFCITTNTHPTGEGQSPVQSGGDGL